jgi:hypothetical protein
VKGFLWWVAALLILAGSASLRAPGAVALANALVASEDFHASGGSPFSGGPTLPVDLDDGDDSEDEEQNEVTGTRPTVAVPPSSVASYLALAPPRLRAAPGHPPGIEEPPRI